MSLAGWLAFAVAAAAGIGILAGDAEAKPARCFTTDDGHYDCDFRSLDPDGSFGISAPGYPTYSVWIDSPGVAAVFVELGGRNVSLPGFYERQRDDGACWANPETDTKLCAW